MWALFATGVLSLYTGRGGEAWIFVAHGVLGFALAALLVWKLRRVWRRIGGSGLARARGRRRSRLASGWVWSSGGELVVGGYNLLAWHMIVGTLLVVVVLVHADPAPQATARARCQRRRAAAVPGARRRRGRAHSRCGSCSARSTPCSGCAARGRRFTGSYERGLVRRQRRLPADVVGGRPPARAGLARTTACGSTAWSTAPLSLSATDLDSGDEVEALLDCTSGWYSRQRWSGTRVDRLLARAGAREGARHLRVVSHTGYRWSFPLDEAAEAAARDPRGRRAAIARPRRTGAARGAGPPRLPVGQVGRPDRADRGGRPGRAGVDGLVERDGRRPRRCLSVGRPRAEAMLRRPALLAQLVEHFHGKEGVSGSSPKEGLRRVPAYARARRRRRERRRRPAS